MNFRRRNHCEDILFAIALVVPAVFAGARYVESNSQITQIAQAQRNMVEAVSAAQAPTNLDPVRSTVAAR